MKNNLHISYSNGFYMREGLRQLFIDIYDSLMEPEPIRGIDHHPSTPMAGFGQPQQPEWHNNFGTAADYQVPAESDAAFESWDWSTWHSGSNDY